MPVEVIMPKVDMDMAEGRLAAWHVAEGEAVTKGAPLFDIETDKAAMEVEAPASGRLHHVIAAPGATVSVGAPVAWIYAEGEAVGAIPGGTPSPPPAAAPEPVAAGPVVAEAPAAEGVRATPAARRLARTAGIELAAVAGSGPRGRVQREDVERLAGAAPAPGGGLHVSTREGTGVPVLLLHGFAGDSTGWLPLERELAGDAALVRIDLPGHGRSPLGEVAGFEALVGAVVAAFDRGVAGAVDVVAHSLGAAVAVALADARPERIASLTLLAPAGLGPEIDAATLLGIARASRVESLQPWLQRLTATPDGIGRDFAKAAMLARTDPAMRAAQVALAGALFPDGTQGFDVRGALGRVAAPTAIVWGRRDGIIPWRHALAAKGEMALHLLPEIGHIPHVEAPGVVAGVVARMRAVGRAAAREERA